MLDLFNDNYSTLWTWVSQYYDGKCCGRPPAPLCKAWQSCLVQNSELKTLNPVMATLATSVLVAQNWPPAGGILQVTPILISKMLYISRPSLWVNKFTLHWSIIQPVTCKAMWLLHDHISPDQINSVIVTNVIISNAFLSSEVSKQDGCLLETLTIHPNFMKSV